MKRVLLLPGVSAAYSRKFKDTSGQFKRAMRRRGSKIDQECGSLLCLIGNNYRFKTPDSPYGVSLLANIFPISIIVVDIG